MPRTPAGHRKSGPLKHCNPCGKESARESLLKSHREGDVKPTRFETLVTLGPAALALDKTAAAICGRKSVFGRLAMTFEMAIRGAPDQHNVGGATKFFA